jgi:stearoyl-CoA desaturase (Delta-9 desaturase)
VTASRRPRALPTLAVRTAPQPLHEGQRSVPTRVVMCLFVVVPFLALLAAVPLAWGRGLSWTDAAIALVAYLVTGLGVSVGLHRYLTHGAFAVSRWLRVTLTLAGGLAVEGSPTQWVADHRRHHQFSDREGDPHSPWRYGGNIRGLSLGLAHAHVGWLFGRDVTNRRRFAPDLLADADIQRLDRWCLPAVSLAVPALAGGLLTWSWAGAVTAFFWGGLVRIAVLHHVTWSINSVCHVLGERPFRCRDRAANFWPLALLSFGESWHNSHHADPACARHGVLRGQLDIAARFIWCLEKLGWARDVRWPDPARLAAKRIA